MVVGTAGVNFIFLSARAYPIRWLVPGLVFLALLMIWPIFFTVYIALTNWSTGNFIEKDQAIERITEGSAYRITGDRAPVVDMYLYADPATLGSAPRSTLHMLIVTETGEVAYGRPRFSDQPGSESTAVDLSSVAVVDDDGDGIPEQIDGLSRLRLINLAGNAGLLDVLILEVPELDGQARSRTFSSATLALQRYEYNAARDVLIDRLDGSECATGEGSFICAGSRIDPGWREVIGFDNFSSVINDDRVRGPFFRVFTWNLIFAIAVVAIQLVLGLGLALTFHDERMRGRKIYRSLLIVPYAAPAFISVIVWRGLLNTSFGPINDLIDPIVMLFRDTSIPWLQDGFWAKIAVILVSVWQGFAYFFLVTSGALTAIPSELQEAARVDGATSPQVFRKITFPLLMVAIAPLIIASFAFNFNAFVNIFLLTSGGPPITGYAVPVGETDILISFTFNLAVASGRGGNFALASAFTFFIFFIVAGISAFSFRFTKRLETIYGNL